MDRQMTKSPRQKPPKKTSDSGSHPDDFISVARRLGCDEDKATFEKKLGKIARAKVQDGGSKSEK
jgi:hypothetical protein